MHDLTTRSAARIVAFAAIALGAATLPAGAQQAGTLPARPEAGSPAPDRQNPMSIAVAVNTRRSGLYQQEDTAGIVALYTEDATYIELLPVLEVLKGRDQIRGHFEELINASAVNIVPTVVRADRNADGTISVSGDYVVLSRDGAETAGHFAQTLRQEDGTWRIAMHVFARPDPLTAAEVDRSGRD